jgi:hypothetical protein
MDDFLNTTVSFAIVVRSDIDTVKEIKRYLTQLPDLQLVYQKLSLDKIFITETPPSGSGGEYESEK